MKLWKKIVLICLLVALLLFIPFTRAIVIFILPLGSGIDDLIVLIAVGIALLVMFYKAITTGVLRFTLWLFKLLDFDEELIAAVEHIKNKL